MIEIKCDTKDSLRIDELSDLQGNLKKLSKQNAEKLKKQIIEHGFCVPFFVWHDNEKNYILDGHQREKVLREMQENGEEIPEKFPVVFIEAKNRKDAKKKLLAINSQYGTMSDDGLKIFLEDIEFNFDELKDFELLNIDLNNFNYIFEIEDEKIKEKEISEEDIECKNECPACGYRW